MYTDVYKQLRAKGETPIWKMCPLCGTLNERDSGCDSMRCGQNVEGSQFKNAHGCGAHFDWIMAKTFQIPLEEEPDEDTPLINNRSNPNRVQDQPPRRTFCADTRTKVRNLLSYGTVSFILGLSFIRGFYVLLAFPEMPSDHIKALSNYREYCETCQAISSENCIENNIDVELGSDWLLTRKALEHREDLYIGVALSEIFIGAMFPIGMVCPNSMLFSSLTLASTLVALPFELLSFAHLGRPSRVSIAEDFKVDTREYPNLHANETIVHITQDSAGEVISYVSRLDGFTENSFKRSSIVLRSLQTGIVIIRFFV